VKADWEDSILLPLGSLAGERTSSLPCPCVGNCFAACHGEPAPAGWPGSFVREWPGGQARLRRESPGHQMFPGTLRRRSTPPGLGQSLRAGRPARGDVKSRTWDGKHAAGRRPLPPRALRGPPLLLPCTPMPASPAEEGHCRPGPATRDLPPRRSLAGKCHIGRAVFPRKSEPRRPWPLLPQPLREPFRRLEISIRVRTYFRPPSTWFGGRRGPRCSASTPRRGYRYSLGSLVATALETQKGGRRGLHGVISRARSAGSGQPQQVDARDHRGFRRTRGRWPAHPCPSTHRAWLRTPLPPGWSWAPAPARRLSSRRRCPASRGPVGGRGRPPNGVVQVAVLQRLRPLSHTREALLAALLGRFPPGSCFTDIAGTAKRFEGPNLTAIGDPFWLPLWHGPHRLGRRVPSPPISRRCCSSCTPALEGVIVGQAL